MVNLNESSRDTIGNQFDQQHTLFDLAKPLILKPPLNIAKLENNGKLTPGNHVYFKYKVDKLYIK